MSEEHIIVIGAGCSGLAAARELAKNGRRVTVIEARSRPGGRVYTRHPEGAPLRVELGAEFLHGRHPDLWQMAKEAGLLICAIDGTHLYFSKDRLIEADTIWNKAEQILSRMELQSDEMTFADFVAREFHSESWQEAIRSAVSYVEGFNAADQNRVSIQWLNRSQTAAREIQDDQQSWIANGFGTLVGWLMEELASHHVGVVFDTVARNIQWGENEVVVRAEGRSSPVVLRGTCVVVTVPLGVLHASHDQPGAITFDPDIPVYRTAAQRLAMGPVFRMTLRFDDAFWQEALPRANGKGVSDLSFLHARDQDIPTWWTAFPLQAPYLTGWAGGPQAARLVSLPPEEQRDRALKSLSHVTGISEAALRDKLVEAHHHDWQRDPFARGAYSYVPAGALDAIATLAEMRDRSLVFAGEATDTSGHNGTVHGAVASGLRAARQILGR